MSPGVRVQVERGLGTRTGGAAGDTVRGARGEARLAVADAGGIAEARLAPVGVDLESEDALGLADLPDDVEAAATAAIELMVAIAVEVSVR